MAASYRKARVKNIAFCRCVSITVFGFTLLLLLLRTNTFIHLITTYSLHSNETLESPHNHTLIPNNKNSNLPKQTELSISLEKRNHFPPRNLHLYPTLATNHIVVVLYVHNRPRYLRIAVDSLSRVEGINETLLIVSHDGYFKEMNEIVESIDFCRVKPIFAPFSPHLFDRTFPAISPNDCTEKHDPASKRCEGTPDQYGNHRSPEVVSLKHHWWWMMNTVWDGLRETSGHAGHILFVEEDHFVYPNAYRNLKSLVKLKGEKCPHCYAANLAPSDVKSRGEGWDRLVAERMGNVGYSFNRTVWKRIRKKAREFCTFDDYNWDITMWATVFPSFGGPVYTLRAPRTSAVHFGKCGLHQGRGDRTACVDDGGGLNVKVDEVDKVGNVKMDWGVYVYENQPGYKAGFRGWGGWGDVRDRQLCLEFAKMYVNG